MFPPHGFASGFYQKRAAAAWADNRINLAD
jgi:hypothetical protein